MFRRIQGSLLGSFSGQELAVVLQVQDPQGIPAQFWQTLTAVIHDPVMNVEVTARVTASKFDENKVTLTARFNELFAGTVFSKEATLTLNGPKNGPHSGTFAARLNRLLMAGIR